VHHGLGDPAGLLEVVLQVRRREVLAARGDDDVLLPAGDLQEAVFVELADVA
jgi:hypothetical protein